MADNQEFQLPGRDGKWEDPALPDTLEAAHARIKALQQALGYYSDARSFVPGSGGNEMPSHDELLADTGLRARIGRLSSDPEEFNAWLGWALGQDQAS